MSFFSQWYDSKKTNGLMLGVFLFVYAALLFIFINVPDQKNNAQIFLTLGVIPSVILLLNYTTSKDNPLFVGLGENENKIFIGLVAGFIAAFILLSAKFSITTLAVTGSDVMKFLYVNIAAPTVEDLFFVAFLFPTTILTLERLRGKKDFFNPLGALAIASITFGLLHIYAYGGNIAAVQNAMIFRGISILGSYALGTIAFSLGLHYALNLKIIQGG